MYNFDIIDYITLAYEKITLYKIIMIIIHTHIHTYMYTHTIRHTHRHVVAMVIILWLLSYGASTTITIATTCLLVISHSHIIHCSSTFDLLIYKLHKAG